jgi:phosphoribosylamine--glycine ligase
VTGVGDTIQKAIETAYAGVKAIHFDGSHYRKDIGWRALKR